MPHLAAFMVFRQEQWCEHCRVQPRALAPCAFLAHWACAAPQTRTLTETLPPPPLRRLVRFDRLA